MKKTLNSYILKTLLIGGVCLSSNLNVSAGDFYIERADFLSIEESILTLRKNISVVLKEKSTQYTLTTNKLLIYRNKDGSIRKIHSFPHSKIVSDGFTLDSDNLFIEQSNGNFNIIRAIGHAKLIKKEQNKVQQVLTAKTIIIHLDTNTIVAKDNVSTEIHNQTKEVSVIQSDKQNINLETEILKATGNAALHYGEYNISCDNQEIHFGEKAPPNKAFLTCINSSQATWQDTTLTSQNLQLWKDDNNELSTILMQNNAHLIKDDLNLLGDRIQISQSDSMIHTQSFDRLSHMYDEQFDAYSSEIIIKQDQEKSISNNDQEDSQGTLYFIKDAVVKDLVNDRVIKSDFVTFDSSSKSFLSNARSDGYINLSSQ